VLYRQAVRLLGAYRLIQKIRLIGLGATGFVPADAPRQQELFTRMETPQEGWEKLDQTLETIKIKFGEKIIRRATLKED
jgi:hypothetical protein